MIFKDVETLTQVNGVPICEKIDKLYEWGTVKVKQYRHGGTDVQVTYQNHSTSSTVNQDYYVEMAGNIAIDPACLRQEDAMLTVNEIAACHATLGHFQWLAVQTQPHMSARCNLLASELANKKIMSVARELQQMVGEILQAPLQKAWQCEVRAKCGFCDFL